MSTTKREGVTLRYDVRGNRGAPPLLMIRGLARSSSYWGEIVELLEDRFCVITFDNRGIGRSDVPTPPYSTQAMADDAAHVVGAAGFDRANVFGVSLGGMIAQQLALRHPRKVTRLVLGATRPGTRHGPGTSARVVYRMLQAIRHPPSEAVVLTAPLALSDRFLEQHPEVLDRWRELASSEKPRLSGFLGQIAAVLRHDVYRELDRISQPTLIVTGDADRLIHPEHSDVLASRIPNAELKILPGVGHDLTTEAPHEMTALFCEFFLESSVGSARHAATV